MTATAHEAATFDVATFDTPTGRITQVDREQRVIRGLAVPFGVEGVKGGKRFMFHPGTVRPYADGLSSVKMWGLHDKALASGVLFEAVETPEGLEVAFRVSRTPAGDNALTLAEDGVWDGLSIGPHETARFQLKNGVWHAVDVPIHEISLTPAPVFGGARVRSVAFDADPRSTMPPEENPTTTGTSTGTATTADAGGGAATAALEAPPTFDTDSIVQAITDGFATLSNPQGGRQVVSAGRPTMTIDEAAPYRFDGHEGEHDFSTDLISAMRGDSESRARVETFMSEALDPVNFAVVPGDVVDVNQPTYRPDMYVDRLVAATPLWAALRKGSLTDGTPFLFPKFVSATTNVADHQLMVEPTPGTFKVGKQTVTPEPVSGKYELPREIVDAGGNPQVSRLIWRELERDYYKNIEAEVSAMLAAANPTAIVLPAGSQDDVLVDALEAELAAFQFIDGGDRFDLATTHVTLYKRLAAASATDGRKLLPIINPSNANGSTSRRFKAIDVAGYEFLPGPSLAGTEADGVRKSYLLASEDVHAWASPPRELRFEYQVAHVDIGIWGYKATAISRLDGVRSINYNRAV